MHMISYQCVCCWRHAVLAVSGGGSLPFRAEAQADALVPGLSGPVTVPVHSAGRTVIVSIYRADKCMQAAMLCLGMQEGDMPGSLRVARFSSSCMLGSV